MTTFVTLNFRSMQQLKRLEFADRVRLSLCTIGHAVRIIWSLRCIKMESGSFLTT